MSDELEILEAQPREDVTRLIPILAYGKYARRSKKELREKLEDPSWGTSWLEVAKNTAISSALTTSTRSQSRYSAEMRFLIPKQSSAHHSILLPQRTCSTGLRKSSIH